ncbi:MAG: hypothetical protein Q8R83_02640 [Legionellaceae bacterium]|nr:hypothetical protein [Legionellaceae bacterium]
MKKTSEVKSIYFGVSVWGRAFCESFINCALASLLAEGNIPALGNSSKANRFIIYTTREDWDWLIVQPLVTLLQQHMDIEFIEMSQLSEMEYKNLNNALNSRKLYLMTLGHRQILEKMFADKAVGSVIIPDSIYSNGSIPAAYQHIVNGKTGVLVFCPRFATTDIVDELRNKNYLQINQPLVIESRDLVAAAMRHLHIDMQMQKWESDSLPEFMLETSWTLPDKSGMLFHTWTCWCAFIDYNKLPEHDVSSLGRNTIDGIYFGNNLTQETSHFITDSDEFTLISFSPNLERKQTPLHWLLRSNKGKLISKIAFAKKTLQGTFNMQTDAFKLQFAKQPIYMHTADLTLADIKLKTQTLPLIDEILKSQLTFFEKISLYLNDPLLWKKIKRRLTHHKILFPIIFSMGFVVGAAVMTALR